MAHKSDQPTKQRRAANSPAKAAHYLAITAAFVFALLLFPAGPQIDSAPGGNTIPETKSSIAAVQLYSDQALVTREATVSFRAGRSTLRFPGLPAALAEDSVQLRLKPATGVRILEVRTISHHKKVFRRAEAKKAEQQVEEAQSALRKLTDEYRALAQESSFLQKIQVGLHPTEGRSMRRVDSLRWEQTLDFVRRSLADNNNRTAELLAKVDSAREQLTVALAVADRHRSTTSLVTKEVRVLVMAASASTAKLELDYRVSGAGWYPNYTARVHTVSAKPNEGKVRLLSYALVRNQTGEDWRNVRLNFSAADPAETAQLPALYSWRIRAKLRPEPKSRPAPGRGAADAPANESRASGSVSRSRLKKSLPKRVAREDNAPAEEPTPAARPPQVQQQLNDRVSKARSFYSRNQTVIKDKRARKRSLEVERNIQAVTTNKVAQEDSFRGGHYQDALTRSEIVLRNIDQLDPKYQVFFANERKRARSIRMRSLRLLEQQELVRDLIDPRRSARGYDYRYTAAGRETVRSDGTFHRVLVNDTELSADLLFEAAPERKPLAFLAGKVTYQGDVPMLAGPVAVFHNSDYVGAAKLGNVSARQTFALHLGNDPAIEIQRRKDEFRSRSGLITEQYDFKRSVHLKIHNRKQTPVTLDLLDRVPVSSDERVKITDLTFSTQPLASSSKSHGLYRFRLNLKAGEKKEIIIRYTLSHPVNVIPRYREGSYPQW